MKFETWNKWKFLTTTSAAAAFQRPDAYNYNYDNIIQIPTEIEKAKKQNEDMQIISRKIVIYINSYILWPGVNVMVVLLCCCSGKEEIKRLEKRKNLTFNPFKWLFIQQGLGRNRKARRLLDTLPLKKMLMVDLYSQSIL